MKKYILIVLFLVASGVRAQDDLPEMHRQVVIDFVNCFKNNDRDTLADLIIYPLKREYPLPSIKNKEEFFRRYDEVFDAKLVSMIVSSNISKDWSAVGWRGIMLQNGELYLDYDGTLIGVNHQSEAEAKMKDELIAQEKAKLHPSLKEFSEPVCILLTEKYRIRIDDMGDYKYRYSSWKRDAKMSDKPDLILDNGEMFPDGSGGNHYYKFKSRKYVYECGIRVIGEEDALPAYLAIYKNDKEILNEEADLVRP